MIKRYTHPKFNMTARPWVLTLPNWKGSASNHRFSGSILIFRGWCISYWFPWDFLVSQPRYLAKPTSRKDRRHRWNSQIFDTFFFGGIEATQICVSWWISRYLLKTIPMDVCLFFDTKNPAKTWVCVSFLGVLSKANDVLSKISSWWILLNNQRLFLYLFWSKPKVPILRFFWEIFEGHLSRNFGLFWDPKLPTKDTHLKRSTRRCELLVVFERTFWDPPQKTPPKPCLNVQSECQVHRGWSMFHGGMHACRS